MNLKVSIKDRPLFFIIDGQWTLDTFNNSIKGTTPGEFYHGEQLQGKRHGYGFQVYANGDSFVGYWAGDMKHGEGITQYANGQYSKDEWYANKKN